MKKVPTKLWLTPLVILVFGAAMTYLVWQMIVEDRIAIRAELTHQQMNAAQTSLGSATAAIEDSAIAARGLLMSAPNLDQSGWALFVKSLSQRDNRQPILSVDVLKRDDTAPMRRTDAGSIPAFIPATRSESMGYLGGFDTPSQLTSIAWAITNGEMTLSSPIEYVRQDGSKARVMVGYLPVYFGATVPQTGAERQVDAAAIIAVSVDADAFARRIAEDQSGAVRSNLLLADSGGRFDAIWKSIPRSENSGQVNSLIVKAAGRVWRIDAADTFQGKFESRDANVIAGGIGIAVILTAIISFFIIANVGAAKILAERLVRDYGRSEARFAAIGNASVDSVILVGGDGRIVYSNSAAKGMLGISAASVGRTVKEAIGYDLPSLEAGRPTNRNLRRLSGETFPAEICRSEIKTDEERMLLWNVTDLTDKVEAEESLRRTNEALKSQARSLEEARRTAEDRRTFLQTLIETMPNPLYFTDSLGRYLGCNAAFERLFGRDRNEIIGATPEEIIGGEPSRISGSSDERVFETGEPDLIELTLPSHDGILLDLIISKGRYGEAGTGNCGIVAVISDVTETKRLQDELRRLATTDSLTGAMNRRHFIEIGDDECRRANRRSRPLSLLMIDIDHFKRINDTYGHACGDEALRQFSETCQSALRHGDAFARLGGEEFAILLPDTDGQAAAAVAERLRLAFEQMSFTYENSTVSYTVSVGVAEVLSVQDKLSDLLGRADASLYEAKQSGRNRVKVSGVPNAA